MALRSDQSENNRDLDEGEGITIEGFTASLNLWLAAKVVLLKLCF